MGRNYIDSTTINPYTNVRVYEDKKKIKQEKLNQLYLMKVTVAGEVGNKEISFTAGYKSNPEYDNTFILDEDGITNLIELLHNAKKELIRDKDVKNRISKLYNILNHYIDNGWVESIKCEVLSGVPDGYNSNIFKTVKITPTFKHDIPDNSDINLGFNFIDVIHIDITDNGFNKLNNRLVNNHTDISVEWINFDRKKEQDKAVKKAKSDYEIAKKNGTLDNRGLSKEEISSMMKYLNK